MNRHTRNSRLQLTAMVAMASMGCFAEAAGTATLDNPAGIGAVRAPVWYIVKEKSLIGNELFEAGQRAQYDGLPAGNLEPTCDIGRARAAEYEASNKARVTKMIEDNKESGVGDPAVFMANFLKAQAQQAEEQAVHIASAVGQAVAAAMAKYFPVSVDSPTAQVAIGDTISTDDTGGTGSPTKRTKT